MENNALAPRTRESLPLFSAPRHPRSNRAHPALYLFQPCDRATELLRGDEIVHCAVLKTAAIAKRHVRERQRSLDGGENNFQESYKWNDAYY